MIIHSVTAKQELNCKCLTVVFEKPTVHWIKIYIYSFRWDNQITAIKVYIKKNKKFKNYESETILDLKWYLQQILQSISSFPG